jgi:hypothetical protein
MMALPRQALPSLLLLLLLLLAVSAADASH